MGAGGERSLFDLSSFTTAVWTQSVAAWMIRLAVLCMVGLLVAFVVSFSFSCNTIIYALMRKRVDNIDLTVVRSIYEEDEDDDLTP